jgi:hypothetical protein
LYVVVMDYAVRGCEGSVARYQLGVVMEEH